MMDLQVACPDDLLPLLCCGLSGKSVLLVSSVPSAALASIQIRRSCGFESLNFMWINLHSRMICIPSRTAIYLYDRLSRVRHASEHAMTQ